MVTVIEGKFGQPLGSVGRLMEETGTEVRTVALHARDDGAATIAVTLSDGSSLLIVLEASEMTRFLEPHRDEPRETQAPALSLAN